MNLLFKSADGFPSDFKDALGYVDADIPYQKIKPDLITATEEIINVIGQTTYDAILANYQLEAGAEGKDTRLTDHARYSIANWAYMLFAPTNDLGHTPNGRRMRSSDDEKTPFEWMMARDDDNLQKRTYRALDILIKYMDASFATWKTSDAYKASHDLFLRTTDEFKVAYQLDSRLILLKMRPGIEECEVQEILPRIGEDLFNQLKTKRKENGELNANEKLLLRLIQKASAYYALSWAVTRLQANLLPEGVLQQVRSDRQILKARVVPVGMEVSHMSLMFEEDAKRQYLEIEKLMKVIDPPVVDTTIVKTDKEIETDTYGFNSDDTFVNT